MARRRSWPCDGHTLLIRRGAEPVDAMDAPVAVGFEDTVEQRAQDQSGQMQCWQERRLVAFAGLRCKPGKSLRQRAVRAVAEINALNEQARQEAAGRSGGAAPRRDHRHPSSPRWCMSKCRPKHTNLKRRSAAATTSAQRTRARVCYER